MAAITASAPGKILLLGGYSVLERPNVAYVLAVDAYVHATVKPIKGDKIVISIPQFKTKISTTTTEIFKESGDKAKFVLNAIKVTLKRFDYLRTKYSGFSLITKSDKQFSVQGGKSGLGSSAAVTVATVAALYEQFGLPLKDNLEGVHALAQYAHALSQEKVGSGFDVAAACFGSIKYRRYSTELLDLAGFSKPFHMNLDCDVDQIDTPGLKIVLASFPKKSMSTTNAVSRVMEFKWNNQREYNNLMSALDRANMDAIYALFNKNLEAFSKAFEEGRKHTKKLGELAGVEIESDGMSRLIEETKKNGAFVAKLPGAGGGDSIVALCLSTKDADSVKQFWKKKGLIVLDINVVKEGVKVKQIR